MLEVILSFTYGTKFKFDGTISELREKLDNALRGEYSFNFGTDRLANGLYQIAFMRLLGTWQAYSDTKVPDLIVWQDEIYCKTTAKNGKNFPLVQFKEV